MRMRGEWLIPLAASNPLGRSLQGGRWRAICVAGLAPVWSVGAIVLVFALPCIAETQTTTTTYQYNADGALTAVTTQVDVQAPTTVYLAWDNFIPNTADATTGTVRSGNGNLVGFGPTPGSGFTAQFRYDQRNRLTSAVAAGAQSTSYTYYPASLMASSTLASGDTLQFYYNVGAIPQVTNIEQPSVTSWSSYLGDVTYLSDGSEQVRCEPRKDVAGVYDAALGSFTPNRYDPYGSSSTETGAVSAPSTGAASYSMRQNPFQYAGEYKDPAWGGYYLRARWYLPEYQTFLARDPGDTVHRYSYAGGNPVGNSDPTGLRYSYGDFSRAVNRFLRPVNRGLRGELLPLVPVYGQIVGGIQLLGNLPEVWHHPNTRTWASFAFLVASVATEAGDAYQGIDRAYGPMKAFGGRIAADFGIGIGQTLLVGYRGHNKWDVPAIVQSVSYNVSGIFWGRLAAGFGYRSHPLSADNVDEMFAQHVANGPDTDALVFKVRQTMGGTSGGSGGVVSSVLSSGHIGETMNATLPVLDLKRVGLYHEGLLAVSRNGAWFTEVSADRNGNYFTATDWNKARLRGSPTEFLESIQGTQENSFQFVGRYRTRDVEEAVIARLPNQGIRIYNAEDDSGVHVPLNTYSAFRNNCQDHVARVLDEIRNP